MLILVLTPTRPYQLVFSENNKPKHITGAKYEGLSLVRLRIAATDYNNGTFSAFFLCFDGIFSSRL